MKTISNILLIVLLLVWAGKATAQIPNCSNSNIIITDTIISQACTNNGQIDVGITGGTAPYTFQWMTDYNLPVLSTSQNLTGAYAGNYVLIVTDSHSTCNTINVYLAPAFQIQSSGTEDTTCPIHSGSLTVIATGGNIPYSYLWSNGGTTATIGGLAPGHFDVTVTDAAGCEVIASHLDSAGLDVYAGGSINLSLTFQNPTTCQNNNGTITATPTGGTSPYTYAWSNNGVLIPSQTGNQATGLAGNDYYTVVVTDANGCVGYGYEYSMTFTSPITLGITSTPQNCSTINGSATVAANGSTAPYTYLWSTGATTQAITGLAAGYFTVTVTDANSCINTSSTYVEYYSPVNANVSSTDQMCNASLGLASAAPTSGTAPYTYSWSNGATTAAVTSLSPGYYEVTVTDNAGCSVASYVYIALGSLITPNATQTDQACPNTLGTATLAPTGGVAPYTYFWSNGATGATITGLQNGNYQYTITDANGCQYLGGNVYINFNSGIEAEVYAQAYPTCLQPNGSAYVYITNGATSLSYLWNNGQTGSTATGLAGGFYQVTITQTTTNCSVIKNISLNAQSPMYATVSVTPATCIFTNDGSATVSLINGTPPYTYAWGNGATTASVDSLHARWGIGVNVTDANGCWADAYQNSVGYQNLSCAAVITGTIVDDLNGDCTFDNGDNELQNTWVGVVPGHGTLSDVYGNYRLLVPAGNYAVTQHALYRNQGCPVGSMVLDNLNAGTVYANNNFYDWPLNVQDLRVSITDIEEPRPGFTHTVRVWFQNNGLFPVSNAVVTFVYDANVTYTGGAYAVNTQTRTITINCGLLPASFGYGYVDLDFTTDPSTPLGTLETYTASITPVINDATPLNNTETEQYPVVSSYDPNLLTVSPKGSGNPGYIAHADSVLKYTIHFQNTGNFAASFVAIRDTLDPGLDPSTIQLGASTAPVTYQLEDNVLIFLLDPIYLPDSSTDQLNSNGVVSFYVKQVKDLAAGTQIHNKTAIYFDFNQPVPTNSVLNTLTDTAEGITTINDEINMQLMPNPSAGQTNVVLSLQQNFTGMLEVTNLLGQTVHAEPINLQPGNYTVPLNLQDQASGIYLVHLSNNSTSHCLKFVKAQ